MNNITVASDKRHFKKGKSDFFYLADTCWSAFTNITLEEWEEYLIYRKMQGFNVIQINTLAQWDASKTKLNIFPFNKNEDGTNNFYSLNQEYFDRAEKMLDMAVCYGFTPALVLLWCNYVPDTWAVKFDSSNILPLDMIEKYVEYVGKKFSKFNPIYIVSGDTDFPGEKTKEYYKVALDTIKRVAPECIRTMHIRGRLMDLPKEFEESESIDFYMYQSGHNSIHKDMTYLLAQNFYKKKVKKPIVNSEPCYEQMGYSRQMYGRFTQFDVRKALWQSLLSGASSGITYGAHGIWSWHRNEGGFASSIGEGFDKPYYWRDALKFKGAWDYSFAKWLFDNYDLCAIEPLEGYIDKSEEIRIAGKSDLSIVLIYIPVNTTVVINKAFNDYEFQIIDLSNRYFGKPQVEIKDGKTVIGMHSFDEDALVIIKEKTI
ncbi:DUF4038 domain-containing protein [Clostridium felsineum]|uniref:apiosidase-like domain-containing protein n=1 Tax=Clostridium felsineum TaxID=36839 RepID=UPI00098C593C|nr:DUF4038 domain-containing protein [Clostridium felsineum]URZ15676.1 hypothetical protein CLFE_017220 [Clostridium felsineum DSM 794]